MLLEACGMCIPRSYTRKLRPDYTDGHSVQDVPSVPDTLDLLVPRCIPLKRVHFVANF